MLFFLILIDFLLQFKLEISDPDLFKDQYFTELVLKLINV